MKDQPSRPALSTPPVPDMPKPTARQVRDEKVAAKADELFRAGGFDLPEAVIEALHEVEPERTKLTVSQRVVLFLVGLIVLSIFAPLVGLFARYALVPLWRFGFVWL